MWLPLRRPAPPGPAYPGNPGKVARTRTARRRGAQRACPGRRRRPARRPSLLSGRGDSLPSPWPPHPISPIRRLPVMGVVLPRCEREPVDRTRRSEGADDLLDVPGRGHSAGGDDDKDSRGAPQEGESPSQPLQLGGLIRVRRAALDALPYAAHTLCRRARDPAGRHRPDGHDEADGDGPAPACGVELVQVPPSEPERQIDSG